jgi:hypothetical protein
MKFVPLRLFDLFQALIYNFVDPWTTMKTASRSGRKTGISCGCGPLLVDLLPGSCYVDDNHIEYIEI